jgi:hypothetical protein
MQSLLCRWDRGIRVLARIHNVVRCGVLARFVVMCYTRIGVGSNVLYMTRRDCFVIAGRDTWFSFCFKLSCDFNADACASGAVGLDASEVLERHACET